LAHENRVPISGAIAVITATVLVAAALIYGGYYYLFIALPAFDAEQLIARENPAAPVYEEAPIDDTAVGAENAQNEPMPAPPSDFGVWESNGAAIPDRNAVMDFVSENIRADYPAFYNNFAVSIEPSAPEQMPQVRVMVQISEELYREVSEMDPLFEEFVFELVMRTAGAYFTENGIDTSGIEFYGSFDVTGYKTAGTGYYTPETREFYWEWEN
jgi:hypothetical protein